MVTAPGLTQPHQTVGTDEQMAVPEAN